MIERELRFTFCQRDWEKLGSAGAWSPARRVTDFTFGPSGETSVQTHGWVIRLRIEDSKTSLEYKAPTNSSWTQWEEIGVGVTEAHPAAEILLKMGLRPGLLLDRVRRTWRYEGAELSWDKMRFLGDYLEVSVQTSDSSLHLAVDAVLQKIGVRPLNEVEAYGVVLLKRLEEDPGLREEMHRHIASFLDSGKLPDW